MPLGWWSTRVCSSHTTPGTRELEYGTCLLPLHMHGCDSQQCAQLCFLSTQRFSHAAGSTPIVVITATLAVWTRTRYLREQPCLCLPPSLLVLGQELRAMLSHYDDSFFLGGGQVFVPSIVESPEAEKKWRMSDFGPTRLLHIVATMVFGWPLYLTINAASRPYPRFANHFDPYSPIFSKRERLEVRAPVAASPAALYPSL
jgi:hypothetical protein